MVYIAACIAFAATFGLIGVMLPWLRSRVVAKVTHRSSHNAPTPQGAGVAIIAVTLCVCGTLFLGGLVPNPPTWPTIAALALGSTLLCGLGVADDIGELPARVRFLGQALTVVGLVFLLPPQPRLFSEVVPLLLERAALAFAGLWFVNLFNFMDGIDWISFAEVTAIGGGIWLLWHFGRAGDAAGATALILTAATAGFAVWNRPKATVFLGDAGSIPMGLILVWLMIDTASRGAWAAVLLFSLYYWTDATVTLLHRLAHGEPIWTAHRLHFYQQATRAGRHGVPRTLAAIALVNWMLVALGVGSELDGRLVVKLVCLAVGAALVAALLRYFRDPADGARRA